MRYQIETHAAAIVLLGKFNPSIFSPAWFAKVGIITDEELENTRNPFTHPEFAQFSIPRFDLNVAPHRFGLVTSHESFIHLVDDVYEIFAKQLPHTPMNMLGINYDAQFKLDTIEQRHALGRALAPIAPWQDFGKRLEPDDRTKLGGMIALIMQENPPDRNQGYRRVQIDPLNGLSNQTGLRMQINDHFQLADFKDEQGATPIMNILRDNFEKSMKEAKAIVSQLMDFASQLQ